MASMQCHKPADQTLSMNEKVCTENHYSGHGLAKTEVRCVETETKFMGQAQGYNNSTQAPAVHGRLGHRRHGERKKGLLHKIKDTLTGHSSDSGSSSSSESDSDGDHKRGGQRKRC